MTMRRAVVALLACALAVASAACAEDQPDTGPIVESVPFRVGEAYRYVLRDQSGDEERGSGTLQVLDAGGGLMLVQSFSDDSGNSDESVLIVRPDTLLPMRGVRSIVDKEGTDRRAVAESEYGQLNEGSYGVRIREKTFLPSDDDEPDNTRCNPLKLPEFAYDNDSSLFLWRAIKFEQGYTVTYTASLANRRQKRPVTLRVRRQEKVETPAGEFDAWLIGIEAEGQAHEAWFSTEPDHKLLVYDNDDLVFLYAGEADDAPNVDVPLGVPPDCK